MCIRDRTSVAYGSANVLSVSCTFIYERYIAGKETSISRKRGNNENKVPQILDLFTV